MQKVALNAVTATTTSDGINVENLENIGISITSAGVTSGTGTFTVDVSNDGTNWETGIALLDAVDASVTSLSASVVTSGNDDTKFVYLTANFGARFIRVVCTVATDGNYTVIVFGNKKI